MKNAGLKGVMLAKHKHQITDLLHGESEIN